MSKNERYIERNERNRGRPVCGFESRRSPHFSLSKLQNSKSGGKKWHSFFPEVAYTGLNYQFGTVKRVDVVEIRIRLQKIYPKLNRDPTKAKKIKKRLTRVGYTLNISPADGKQPIKRQKTP